MNNLEYATIYFSNGQEFTKDITNVEVVATLDEKSGDVAVSVLAELSSTASAVSMTLTKERWQKLAQEVQEMIEHLETEEK